MNVIKMLWVIFLLPCSLHAAEPKLPLTFKGYYIFTFSTIPFGRLEVSFNQTATQYDATADVGITGIAKLFVRHESHTTSKGSGRDFNYSNMEYESNYFTNKKKKYAHFIKKDGVITRDEVRPPDNRAIRPAVPLEMKSVAYDPLSLGLALRVKLAELLEKQAEQFTLDFYDGRRLTRAYVNYEGESTIRLYGEKIPVYMISAKRDPLAGFTKKDLERAAEPEPPLTIYFTQDTLIPIRLEVEFPYGLVAATLTQESHL